MENPILKNLTTLDDLLLLINSYYIKGLKQDLSAKEKLITNQIFQSNIYTALYDEFIKTATNVKSKFQILQMFMWQSIIHCKI